MTKLGIVNLIMLVSVLLFLTGCEVVEGIFKAGVWVGIISVVLVIVLVIIVIKKLF